MSKKVAILFVLAITLFVSTLVSAQQLNYTPDSTRPGPHPIASGEYRLTPIIDPDVLPDRMTEVWAKVYYPNDTKTTKAPLIIMLHGNHPTCGIGANPRIDDSCAYTQLGVCPAGYVPVPNHTGYDYIAENLASWGYWVVSINANRGINCGDGIDKDQGLNLARGRLILKHLSLIHQWATVGGAPASIGLGSEGFIGKIDFSSVGLFGHSRGGEGARAAYNLYLDPDSVWPTKIPGLSIKAIFEIGAVDGQTARVLNADGITWNQLLPLCDGDVIDHQGRNPFERMMLNFSEGATAQKSLYEVWGANHNFFNTEWQRSDAFYCEAGTPAIFDPKSTGSPQQQKIALASVSAFFRSQLGKNTDPAFNQLFNPLAPTPRHMTDITQIDRDFTPSPGSANSKIVEEFDKETGTNSSGKRNLHSQINIEHIAFITMKRDTWTRAARIEWTQPGQTTFFEAIWASPSQGQDIHDFATLDFRIGRRIDDPNNTEPSTQFGIALEEASGRLSSIVRVSDYATINGPGAWTRVLQTVRIPLSAFQGVDLTKIRGVKFIFDQTKTGTLWLANIRLHRQVGLGGMHTPIAMQPPLTKAHKAAKKLTPTYVPAHLNTIQRIHRVGSSQSSLGRPAVEIRMASQVPFPVMNRLPVLKIGEKEFSLSRYSDLTTLKELTFILSEDEYNALAANSEVIVINGKIWNFGKLRKL